MGVHLAKGTRDILPGAARNRRAVLRVVRDVFELYGFEPLETPAVERLEILDGKYGAELDKLMFRILKRGEGGVQGGAWRGCRGGKDSGGAERRGRGRAVRFLPRRNRPAGRC